MIKRPLLFSGVLAAALIVPYILLDGHLAQTVRGQFSRLWGKANQEQEDLLAGIKVSARGEASGPAANMAPSPAAVSIEEAFRFDITPQWVASRWPRASTVLGEPKQLGMRVALVSGTQPNDLAGSLTYYFSERHQLQRITFAGMTGDPRRLLAAVATSNGLKSMPTTSAAHYIAGDPKQPTSQVVVRHLPLVRSQTAHARVEVAVDLRRRDAVEWRRNAAQEPEPSLLPSSYRRW
jgi:hypothetical protein